MEGALDAEQRRQFEARLAEDPELRAELAGLRRTQPRLRQAALHLRQTESAVAAPLWPRLRDRLDTNPASRFGRGPVLWGVGGLCAAGALVLAVVLGPNVRHPAPERRMARAVRVTTRIVSPRDNRIGTPVAEKLRQHAAQVATEKQAAQVATEKQAIHPRIAARLQPVKLLPAAPPAAPQLPRGRVTGTLPMPVAPPVRMAKREPDRLLYF